MKARHYFFVIFFGIFFAIGAHAEPVSHIVISQIQISGQTAADEFIELYNPTGAVISIAGWKLVKKTSSGSQSNLVSGFTDGTVVGPHKYFLITHKTGYLGGVPGDTTYSGSSYSIAANNTIILLDGGGEVVDKVGFGEAADFEGAPALNPETGQTLRRKGWESGIMQDTDNNQSDFEVGVSSPRNSSYGGTYTPPAQTSSSTPPSAPAPLSQSFTNFEKGALLINEIYPVADTGEKEWIELYNPSQNSISLDGWTMEDAKTLIASLYGTISKYSTWEITPSRLNNDGDTVKLKSPNGQIIDIVSYGKMASSTPVPKPGESLSRKVDGFYTESEADFVITQTPTAGERNIITAAAEEEDAEDLSNDPIPATSTPPAAKKTRAAKKLFGNISARGIVIVPPGLFSSQYFYIQKDDGGGVQIYSFKSADIPKLAVGDYIYVYGAGSSYLGEPRIKTKSGGIKLLEKRSAPAPTEIGIDELDEGMSGALVKISGEITEKKSAGMYLDDGAGEVYVSIKKKAGINLQDILPGNEAEITGVLIYNDKGFSVLPRFGEDIKKIGVGNATVPGATSLLVNILKYTLPAVGAISIGIVAYFWRMKKKLVFEGAEIVEETIPSP